MPWFWIIFWLAVPGALFAAFMLWVLSAQYWRR